MPYNPNKIESLERYRAYHREYQRKYGKTHKRDRVVDKRKYYIYKKISQVFRNILLEN